LWFGHYKVTKNIANVLITKQLFLINFHRTHVILLNNYCNKHGITLTFVGHSLGGGMAALASMLTNRTAITYNPAGALGIRMSVAKFLNIPMNTSHIYAYIMEGDPVTSVQEIFGIHAEGHVKIVTNKKGGSAHSIMNMFENLKRK
jgi:hypothetical protein